MSTKSASCKAFSVLALLAVLALAGLPLQAQASRRPSAGHPPVAAAGEEGIFARLLSLVTHFGRPEMALKEGTSIDPDGRKATGSTVTSAPGDEGTSIDPNGRR